MKFLEPFEGAIARASFRTSGVIPTDLGHCFGREGEAAIAIYARYLLARIIDLAMRNKETARLRAEWIPHARGEVLEMGIGSSLNLPFYSEHVQCVYGVDPSIELQRMAQRKLLSRPIRLNSSCSPPKTNCHSRREHRYCSHHVDAVFYSGCAKSASANKSHYEGGWASHFVEYGRSQDPGVALWQERITPAWKRVGGGCHLDRKIDELVRRAGFRIPELKTGYIPGLRPITYTYQDRAKKDLTRA